MMLYERKDECCGCGACASACPTGAITMEPDLDGFVYPVVNRNVCRVCSACRTICLTRSTYRSSHAPLAVFAAVHRDKEVLASSASGGVFAALASLAFRRYGVVFGCAYGNDLRPEHICIDGPDDLGRLQGSKYVQSDTGSSYSDARRYLDQGRLVLFTGTPCQVAGLRSYLRKEYHNLVTADLICHGVPSAALFQAYIKMLEVRLGKVVDFRFRDKRLGWGCMGTVVYAKQGGLYTRTVSAIESSYYWYFLRGYTHRESCYRCRYASLHRPGDFTMGDYWGIQQAHPDLEVSRGVSALLVNSQKGMTLVDDLGKLMELTESTLQKVTPRNQQLRQPMRQPHQRVTILKMYRKGGYAAVEDYFQKQMRWQRPLMRLKGVVPLPIRTTARRLLRRWF